MNKKEISTKEELKKDIEKIKEDIIWAKENNIEILEFLENSLKQKEQKLKKWSNEGE